MIGRWRDDVLLQFCRRHHRSRTIDEPLQPTIVHIIVWQGFNRHIATMCGRVIQSSAPIRYAIVDGMNVCDGRLHNYPPRWNGAPSQNLLVIRRNFQTGEVSREPLQWGLIPLAAAEPTS